MKGVKVYCQLHQFRPYSSNRESDPTTPKTESKLCPLFGFSQTKINVA